MKDAGGNLYSPSRSPWRDQGLCLDSLLGLPPTGAGHVSYKTEGVLLGCGDQPWLCYIHLAINASAACSHYCCEETLQKAAPLITKNFLFSKSVLVGSYVH